MSARNVHHTHRSPTASTFLHQSEAAISRRPAYAGQHVRARRLPSPLTKAWGRSRLHGPEPPGAWSAKVTRIGMCEDQNERTQLCASLGLVKSEPGIPFTLPAPPDPMRCTFTTLTGVSASPSCSRYSRSFLHEARILSVFDLPGMRWVE